MPNVWKKKTIIQNIDNETELFTYTKKNTERYRVKESEWVNGVNTLY